MPSNQVSVHRSGIPGSCGDGLKGVPLSQTLFSVAEDSKQDTSSFVAPNPEPAWVLSRWVEVPDTGRVDDHMDSLALETGRQTHYA